MAARLPVAAGLAARLPGAQQLALDMLAAAAQHACAAPCCIGKQVASQGAHTSRTVSIASSACATADRMALFYAGRNPALRVVRK
jgi:hypothetical protein